MSEGQGLGTTIAFAVTGLTGKVMRITPYNPSVEDVETSHLGTTVGKTYEGSDLLEPGETAFDLQIDQDIEIPIGISELVTVTYPLRSGFSTPANEAGQGYIKSFAPGPLEAGVLHTGTVIVKWSGKPTKTPSAV